MAGSGTVFVPTLVAMDAARDGRDDATERADREEAADMHRRTVAAAIERGARVATGTDCGSRGVTPDMLAREVRLIHEAGASPIDAIRGATQWAAELLGLENEIGFVRAGLTADLVLVDGDVLADLGSLDRPRMVVQGGRVVPL